MATPNLLIAGSGAVMCLLAVALIIFSGLLRPNGKRGAKACTAPLRLAPMERLLAKAEFDFIAGQPGFQRQMMGQMRKRRLALFASYLNQVEAEFHRLHGLLRLLTLHAGVDSPAVSRAMVEQRFLFSIRLMQVRYRMFLFRFGLLPVNVEGIATVMEHMREQVAQLQALVSPVMTPSAA